MRHQVAGGGHPPPAPTEPSVRLSRTTLGGDKGEIRIAVGNRIAMRPPHKTESLVVRRPMPRNDIGIIAAYSTLYKGQKALMLCGRFGAHNF
jgi:hypothetical protein